MLTTYFACSTRTDLRCVAASRATLRCGPTPPTWSRRCGSASSRACLSGTRASASAVGRLVAGHADMRRGFGGLAAMVQTALTANPFCVHVFVFRGRRGDILK
ncbi:IS66 family insertion sequence element accessory protein TnpB [Variovorax sp. LjRoot84]|uniref:IS66 family insertion sequence element accessory protein TnpB n=1 Tax=Variovorax sp. LjRoot84 TaxID=3342340 RepID=UPI003F510AD2